MDQMDPLVPWLRILFKQLVLSRNAASTEAASRKSSRRQKKLEHLCRKHNVNEVNPSQAKPPIDAVRLGSPRFANIYISLCRQTLSGGSVHKFHQATLVPLQSSTRAFFQPHLVVAVRGSAGNLHTPPLLLGQTVQFVHHQAVPFTLPLAPLTHM